MSIVLDRVEEKLLCADEFMALPFDRVELVRGKVVHLMPPLFIHSICVKRVSDALSAWADRTGRGFVSVEASFLLSRDPDIVRAPDVFFVTNEHLQGQKFDSYIEGAPLLAVEVKSKNETLDSLLDKAAEYLQAGSQQVWIVQPGRQRVLVLSQDDSEISYRIGESISGGEALPGLDLSVAEVFRSL